MGQVVKKAEAAGGKMLFVTDRGTTFGYNNLVSDMRSMPIMREFGWPVVFDATIRCRCPVVAATSPAGMESMRPRWHARGGGWGEWCFH